MMATPTPRRVLGERFLKVLIVVSKEALVSVTLAGTRVPEHGGLMIWGARQIYILHCPDHL